MLHFVQWTPVYFGTRIPRNGTRGTCFCSLAGDLAGGGVLPQEPLEKKSRRIAGIDQSVLVDPWLLADPNSRFAEYNGVQVHYKISTSTGGGQVCPAVLLHGFGASVFSWERILEPLSKLLSSAAVAFDRPGFGLTSRVFPANAPENPYSLAFSAAITIAFIEFLKADKAILIGHSAGCIAAAEAYFRAPERVAAIVMIAPAIVAPLKLSPTKNNKETNNTDEETTSDTRSSGPLLQFVLALFIKLRLIVISICSRFLSLAQSVHEILTVFYCKLISAALRTKAAIWLVQRVMDAYGEKMVRSAWYNPEKADKSVIRGYTKPLGCRNWERGLLEYVIALVATRNKGQKLADRLATISCPVLVVTGDRDRIVPAWNAERLSRVVPRSSFKVINECGHLPHEEKPEEVIEIIQHFVKKFL